MWRSTVFALALLIFAAANLQSQSAPPDTDPVGHRPYEMDWANRSTDTRPPLIDFEDLGGWRIEEHVATATFARTRQQQLWGTYVGGLTYQGTGGAAGSVILRPPQPIPLPAGADCVNLWVCGNRLGWEYNPKDPPAQVGVVFRDRAGKELAVPLHAVDWKEWHLLHHKFSAEQTRVLADGGAFAGISVGNIVSTEPRKIWFDNLAVYKEELKTLTFDPRPKRNLTPFEGQSPGLSTGPGTLPFPTRQQTILPTSRGPAYTCELARQGDACVFTCRGTDRPTLTYRYEPKTADLGDITATWDGVTFRPMAEGGVCFAPEDAASLMATAKPDKAKLVSCTAADGIVTAAWQLTRGPRTIDATYRLRVWDKSLVVDVLAPGGQVGEVRFGRATGLRAPRQVPVPFLDFRQAKRPLTLVFDSPRGPLFLAGYVDWYRSNASELFNADEFGDDWAEYNGGARYLPKTDGRRNDCFERLFLTISDEFDETLPTVANPKSPWMDAMAERVWRAHGASDRQRDYAQFARYARMGMTKLLITDHETGWRDGCESFTFRTRTAPGRGGDESQAWYAREMQALGFRYGIYNNYTDYAPVNGFWDEDNVARRPDGNWLTAWYRCYTPKPARAVEYEARLAPVIQEKFHLSTAYCDVHTAIPPWSKEDYDARVPGAGTLAGTFYAYGEIMLHQKRTWDGPVYSEGGSHWIYVGLTDGNYGQDEPAELPTRPWLVDFDLLRLHPLGTSFGMGNPEMFFGSRSKPFKDPAARDANLDLFLAATVAFGHTGFFVVEAGPAGAARSYFMLQSAARQYAAAEVREIRYAGPDGQWLPSSVAIGSGAEASRQILTRYRNGCVTVVNGHPSRRLAYAIPGGARFVLPPAGYLVYGEDPATGGPRVYACSGWIDGHRADCAQSPDYTYCDGRGTFTVFDQVTGNVASDGPLIVLHRGPAEYELIPLPGCREFGADVRGTATSAVALDEARHEIGPAEVRVARSVAYVRPVNGAFSYVLRSDGKPLPQSADAPPLRAVPGQQTAAGPIPVDARPGTHAWLTQGQAWVDFVVVPLARQDAAIEENSLLLSLTSNAPAPATFTAELAGFPVTCELRPGERGVLTFPLAKLTGAEDADGAWKLPLLVSCGAVRQRSTWTLTSEHRCPTVVAWPARYATGQCLRGGSDGPLAADGGASLHAGQLSCGGVARSGLFMHPPYKRGVGCTFASYTLDLPAQPAALRCSVGKQDGSARGDGILFRVAVVNEQGQRSIVAERLQVEHAWSDLEADLSKWAGRRVRLQLIADVGPADNSSGDWACWSDMRLETVRPTRLCRVEPADERR